GGGKEWDRRGGSAHSGVFGCCLLAEEEQHTQYACNPDRYPKSNGQAPPPAVRALNGTTTRCSVAGHSRAKLHQRQCIPGLGENSCAAMPSAASSIFLRTRSNCANVRPVMISSLPRTFNSTSSRGAYFISAAPMA